MKNAPMAALGMAAALAGLAAISLLPSLGASAQAAQPAKHYPAQTVRLQADRGALDSTTASNHTGVYSLPFNLSAWYVVRPVCRHFCGLWLV